MSGETVILIAAILATVVGVGTFFHYVLTILRWTKATGTVVGNVSKMRPIDKSAQAHFPRIAFTAADGKDYEVEGDIGLNDEWPIGLQVTLRYRAADPSHATIARNWQRLLFSLVFIGFAAVMWLLWFAAPKA